MRVNVVSSTLMRLMKKASLLIRVHRQRVTLFTLAASLRESVSAGLW